MRHHWRNTHKHSLDIHRALGQGLDGIDSAGHAFPCDAPYHYGDGSFYCIYILIWVILQPGNYEYYLNAFSSCRIWIGGTSVPSDLTSLSSNNKWQHRIMPWDELCTGRGGTNDNKSNLRNRRVTQWRKPRRINKITNKMSPLLMVRNCRNTAH